MTDIKQIAATCADRIFDRMELCRGSAMLKSDIEREVEQSLREELDVDPDWAGGCNVFAAPAPPTTAEAIFNESYQAVMRKRGVSSAITPKQAEERGIPMGADGHVWVEEPNGLLHHIETGVVFMSDDGEESTQEEIAGVGYINDDKEHVLISIRNPTITSEYPKPTCAQIVVTLENARELATKLSSFIWQHDAENEGTSVQAVFDKAYESVRQKRSKVNNA